MRNTKLLILFTALLLANFAFGQEQSEEDKKAFLRGAEIIQKARNAVYKDIKFKDVKTLYIHAKGELVEESTATWGNMPLFSPSTDVKHFTVEYRYSLEFPDKIRGQLAAHLSNGKSSKVIEIFNGEKAWANRGYYTEDDKVDPALPSFNYPTESALLFIWRNLFHLILYSYTNPDLEFKHVGKAKLPNGMADVLEVGRERAEQEGQGKYTLRMFFDEKTHYLLMMTHESSFQMEGEMSDSEYNRVDTYYFSDHKVIHGMVIPQSINLKRKYKGITKRRKDKSLPKDIIDKSTGEYTRELKVKDVKINHKFAPQTFKIPAEKDH